MKKIILAIDGMTCSACSNGLEKYLNKQNGIIEANVNLVMANATIIYDDNILKEQKINEFVKKAGFKSLGYFKNIDIESKTKKEKVKFISSTVLAIIFMYISMGHMIGLPMFKIIDIHINTINYTICLFVFTIIFLIYGFDILKNGYKNLIHRTPNMDTLVSIGVISSFLYSIYLMISIFKGNFGNAHNLYFESASIVIYFIKLGRYLDGISKDKTKEATKKLVEITPNSAIIKVNGEEKIVTLDEIKKGDILVCKPGDRVAVDGEIIDGTSHFDEAFITGESKPVNKEKGDMVVAGSINYDGYIEYRAEKIGKDSTISEIVRLVVEASNTKIKIAKLADTVSLYFVPVIIILSLVTLIAYLILGYEFSYALERFISVLVVACPCSLGLATPLAIVVSEGLCASNGILVKRSEILENAKKVNTIVFDKTGTLTYGKLKIAGIINYSDMSNEYILKIAGSIEIKSTHPISKAFLDYLEDNNIDALQVDNFCNIAGLGITGEIENELFILGNRKIIEKYNIQNNYINDENQLSEDGNSIVYIANNKGILALVGVNDIIRENANEVIKKLNDKNINVIMLTGDNKIAANSVASKVGIKNVISEVLPQDKTNVIKKLKEENKYVIMCGDGINDSPALAMADIGISINGASDIALDSSDVILTRANLFSILNLITISNKTIKNIKQNLFWAFFYNILMVPIAMGLFTKFSISINPMIASIAMMFSSLTVVINAIRLKKIKIM